MSTKASKRPEHSTRRDHVAALFLVDNRENLSPPLVAVAALMTTSVYAQGSEVVRHGLPDADFPILQAVEVPADATLVYLSGTVPTVADEAAEKGSSEYFGDTATQTASVLASIEKKLAGLDLDMGDVIKMQAYLVAPEGSDGIDFQGFMEGYTQYFGTEEQLRQPDSLGLHSTTITGLLPASANAIRRSSDIVCDP